MKKVLVFVIFSDGCSVASHSKEMELSQDETAEDAKEEIITSALLESGMLREHIHELFVFESADNPLSAPRDVAYWTAEELEADVYEHGQHSDD